MDIPLHESLYNIFKGYSKAYGTFRVDRPSDDNIEVKRKGRAQTIKERVGVDNWKEHIEGTKGIGIVPLMDDDTVMFSVIDIDDYSISIQELNDRINSNNLPLTLFRSKSGGAHLYVFYSEPTQAKESINALKKMSEVLGFPGVEIFPKQDRRTKDTIIGNWINMPYFKAEETERYAIDQDGNRVTHDRIVDFIYKRRIRPDSLKHFIGSKEKPPAKKEEISEPLKGGPPCLNKLIIQGFPEGTRNNMLFNIGVYFKKAFPSAWKEHIRRFNEAKVEPSLSIKEVNNLIRSLDVNDYNYRCSETPISAVCDKQRCLVCTYGVRPTDELPKLGRLVKIMTDPPIWQVSVIDGGIIEVSTEQLLSPRLFQLACTEALNIIPPICKAEEWRQIIKKLLENVVIQEVNEDDTPKGRLIALLWEFLEGRIQAVKREEILQDKPWQNNEKHYFNIKSFKKFLDREKFNEIKQNKIISIIKEITGCEKEFLNINGSGRNVWTIPTRITENEPN